MFVAERELSELTPKRVRRRGVIDLGDLPGEDTEFGLEPAPRAQSMLYIDCSVALASEVWRSVRDYVGHRAGWACEFCGEELGLETRVCELFAYDEDAGREVLTGLVGACPECAGVLAAEESATEHYAEVAGISVAEAEADFDAAITEVDEQLGDRQWVFDIGLLAPWVTRVLAKVG